MQPIELTNDEIEIFGKPNFACAHYARILIAAGVYKAAGNKAEYEQAVFMHWASELLKVHGKNWRDVGKKQLRKYLSSINDDIKNIR